MLIKKSETGFLPESLEVIGMLVNEAEPENVVLDPLRGEIRDFCRKHVINEHFYGKMGTSILLHVSGDTVKYVYIHGIGKKNEALCENAIRTGAFNVVRLAAKKGCSTIALNVPCAEYKVRSRSIAEGSILGLYKFNKYLAEDKDDTFKEPRELIVLNGNEDGINEGTVLGEAQCYVRDLANEPGNIINPQVLSAKALALADELSLECEIWNEERIRNEKMEAYYSVGRGSANPPRFIRLTYTPKQEFKEHVVFVGKGVTFDSGGLNIKPAEYMLTMKGDKSGACAVLGAIRAASKLKLPVKLSVIIAAAENMPGGNSFRPDDILRARNGKTIEINNTDAEGRLTLADALCYASELNPDKIVDIATLTGACAVALGSSTGGLFTNNDELGEKIIAASKSSGERFWKMPMDDANLRKSIKSSFADLSNCGERYGGAITAAMFLEAFVEKDIPWAHLDIAGIDFIKKPWSYYVEGASGFGMRTLASLLMEL